MAGTRHSKLRPAGHFERWPCFCRPASRLLGRDSLRIALVTEYYYPHLGGVTEHVHNLTLQLQRQGHPTIVVTANMQRPSGDLEQTTADTPFVRRVGTSRTIYSAGSFARVTTGRNLRRRLRELFQREGTDVVHVHGGLNPTLGLVAPGAAADLDLPVVATFHSWFAGSALCRVFRRVLQQQLDRHAAVVAVSQPVIEAHSRYFDADWEIIPNGVDTDFFLADVRSEARTSAGPDGSRRDPALLFLGRAASSRGSQGVYRRVSDGLRLGGRHESTIRNG